MSRPRAQDTRSTTYSNFDADPQAESINTVDQYHDRKGHLVKQVSSLDWDADSDTDRQTVVTMEYDRKGNVVLRDYLTDNDADGAFDIHTVHAYKFKHGVEVDRIEKSDYQNDGTFENTWHTETTLNKRADPVKVTSTHYPDENSPADMVNTNTYAYDRQGRLTGKSSDYLSDGVPESWMTREYARNGYTETHFNDDDQDGVVNNSYKTQYVLDKKGNVILEKTESDASNDGSADRTTTIEREFNKKGLMTSESMLDQFAGNPEGDFSYTKTLEYNKVGQVTHQATTVNSPGTPIFTDYVDYTYNEQGKLVESVFDYNGSGEGGADRTDRFVWQYDEDGRLTYESADYGDDGVLEHWITHEALIA